MRTHVLGATAATLALTVGINAASAQQQSPSTATAQQQPARQCLDDLRAFNDRMRQDGFWLAGWGGQAAGSMSAPSGAMTQTMGRTSGATNPSGVPPQPGNRSAAGSAAMGQDQTNATGNRGVASGTTAQSGASATNDPAVSDNNQSVNVPGGNAANSSQATRPTPANQSPAARAPNTQDNAVTATRSPWAGASWGISSPPYQIRALHAAANVLGVRGAQEGCETVLSELRDVYDSYAGQLRQAGVEAGDVTSWRQQRMVSARPVGDIQPGLLNLGNITGTELRNPQDEELGTVENVVLDPQSGEIRYVIVSHGGVLGIGEDRVAVPWTALRATPGLDTFVLNVSEQVIEDAPSVDVDALSGQGRPGQERDIDRYWHDHIEG